MKHRLLLLYCWAVRSLLYFLPDAPFIMRFRGWLYSFGMHKAGRNFQVAHNVIFNTIEGITVGNNVYIAQYSIIYGAGEVQIGDDVMFGPGCMISSSNHVFQNNKYCMKERTCKKVYIGTGSWVAGHTTILAGGNLPPKSILAAGGILTHSFSEEGIYGGIPAKLLRKG